MGLGMTMAADRDSSSGQGWERGWDGHLSEQRRRLAKLPLAEKLQWLEEAQRLAKYLNKDREAPGKSGADLLHDSEDNTESS